MLIAGLVLSGTVTAQSGFDDGFNAPWANRDRALVLDARYNNVIDWIELSKDKRVAGIILRSTGVSRKPGGNGWTVTSDTQYQTVRRAARENGYLWGSFHMGAAEWIMPAKEQARFYLDHIDNADDEALALDLEDFSSDPSRSHFMQLEGARAFIQYIYDHTGRYPLVYVTGSIYDEIVASERNNRRSVFAKAPLWYARPAANIAKFFRDPPEGWWNTYSLWQFSSELNCGFGSWGNSPPPATCPFEAGRPGRGVPHVTGVEKDMDVDVFNGTVEDLRKAWPFSRKAPGVIGQNATHHIKHDIAEMCPVHSFCPLTFNQAETAVIPGH
jgi:hypothetical protein